MSNETRKLPTRPGAWWWQDNLGIGNPPRVIPVLEVADDEAPYLLAIMPALPTSLFVPVAETGGAWLAPIPGPAVLAALAEYDRLDALIEGSDEVHADQPDVLRVMLRRSEALSALALAIRAERDGAA